MLFFGQLKDIVGRSEQILELEEGSTLNSIWLRFASQHPALEGLRKSVVFAKNQQFSPPETPVIDGDEVAYLPPVSGGSAKYSHMIEDPQGHFFALTRQPIDLDELRARVRRDEDGAIDAFEGVVRNNTKGRATKRLDYECYEAMAINLMAQIGLEIAAAHAIGRIAMVHRLGTMEVGETSVVVIVSAPHRRPSFEAALEGINRLKKLVPIWKKEYFADGEVWVEGEWDESLLSH